MDKKNYYDKDGLPIKIFDIKEKKDITNDEIKQQATKIQENDISLSKDLTLEVEEKEIKMFTKKCGTLIKNARLRLRIESNALAQKIGCVPSVMIKIEDGNYPYNGQLLIKINKQLGTSIRNI